jgi:hypothetical protein
LIINNQSIQQHAGKWDGSCHLSTTKGTFPFSRVLLDWLLMIKKLPNDSCHLSTTKGTFPFSRVLLDSLVINDKKLPNWQLPSIDNKRYFPIFPCVVGMIGY